MSKINVKENIKTAIQNTRLNTKLDDIDIELLATNITNYLEKIYRMD